MDMSEERLQELLASASSKAVQEYVNSKDTKEVKVTAEATAEVAEEKEIEQCVTKLMDDADFKPKDGEDKRSAAYAVCTAQVKKSDKADQVSEALTQLNATLLTSALINASLPEIAEQRIRTQFQGRSFNANVVQEAIAGEKDYLASLTKIAVENVTKESGKVTTDEGDKKLARMDASLTASRVMTAENGEKVKGYRTFTEAYCDWTGKNPLHVGREEVWEAWMGGSRGYASWREEAVQRLYTEALSSSGWGEGYADRMHKALVEK